MIFDVAQFGTLLTLTRDILLCVTGTQVSQIDCVLRHRLRYNSLPVDYSLLVEIRDGFIAVSAVCVRIIYQVVVSRAAGSVLRAVSKAFSQVRTLKRFRAKRPGGLGCRSHSKCSPITVTVTVIRLVAARHRSIIGTTLTLELTGTKDSRSSFDSQQCRKALGGTMRLRRLDPLKRCSRSHRPMRHNVIFPSQVNVALALSAPALSRMGLEAGRVRISSASA